jgi:hypothetical protein
MENTILTNILTNIINNIETLNVSGISRNDENDENFNITIDNNTLNNLTANLESEIFANLSITPEIAEAILFPDIRKLLYLSIKMRKQLLSKWKYYNEFLLTIDEHSNNQQSNNLLSWEQSFTMTLLLFIHH